MAQVIEFSSGNKRGGHIADMLLALAPASTILTVEDDLSAQ